MSSKERKRVRELLTKVVNLILSRMKQFFFSFHPSDYLNCRPLSFKRERERGRERQRDRQTERGRE